MTQSLQWRRRAVLVVVSGLISAIALVPVQAAVGKSRPARAYESIRQPLTVRQYRAWQRSAEARLRSEGASSMHALPPHGSLGTAVATFPTNSAVIVFSGDSVNALNAYACGSPTNLIVYPVTAGCGNYAQELWDFTELQNGYDQIVAYYGGHFMCANVQGYNYSSGVQVIAYNCDQVVTSNEWFRRPENTPDPYASGWSYIVPYGNYSLTLNVWGGLGQGHAVKLYGQCNCRNDAWFFQTSP